MVGEMQSVTKGFANETKYHRVMNGGGQMAYMFTYERLQSTMYIKKYNGTFHSIHTKTILPS